jgi:hypothetical protein
MSQEFERVKVINGSRVSEVMITSCGIYVLGAPDEADDHNCDFMGCGTSHVIARQLTPEFLRKPIAGLYIEKEHPKDFLNPVYHIKIAVTGREVCTISGDVPGAEEFAEMFVEASIKRAELSR